MSNYAYAGVLGDPGRAVVGPETVNGTGQVYIQADDLCFLTNEEARELGRALIEAADYAKAVQEEMEEHPVGMPPDSVRRYEWTNPDWRYGVRCSASHRTEFHGIAHCQNSEGHTGKHEGSAERHPGPFQLDSED